MTNTTPLPAPLPDGIHELPAGKLAAVVTYLEMFTRPAPRAAPEQPELTLVRHEAPDLDWYRALYRRVGEDWLWFSRLYMEEAALAAILTHPDVEVYSVRKGGVDLGILELDFRDAENTELAFFGLHESLIGGGTGRWLMEHALDKAFAHDIKRLFVHTCTLDSPQALPFYIRSGFTPYGRAIEVMDDPRVAGALPKSAAPHIPLIG
ncbi:GNAT family N-acetyltransferase [Celeribacter halophilus]|uniref:GNAT family N-acetyltransferase n=1 Tax=Celeribacter halophilus TaxID=576117 RepID=A0AAW7XTC2_9RHOB|nr:GNAT family N-acetyltransferase [Celeribacter halophilus]MDO6457521.1 GNAT family N-acetyltransferase [Celeribacter halophilus]MDO6724484.1 GNAT family N-acetyltransferase [Celeribacter halophilus]